jgi:hypothetical protein
MILLMQISVIDRGVLIGVKGDAIGGSAGA